MTKLYVSLLSLAVSVPALAAPATGLVTGAVVVAAKGYTTWKEGLPLPVAVPTDPRLVVAQALQACKLAISAREQAQTALSSASQALDKAQADCKDCGKQLKAAPKKSAQAKEAQENQSAAQKRVNDARAEHTKMCQALTAAKVQERTTGLMAAAALLVYAEHPKLAKLA